MTFSTRAAATALTGLVIFGCASAAFATTEKEYLISRTYAAHIELVKAVEDAGVNVVFNHPVCQEVAGINGFYAGKERLLAVCNDRYIPRLNEDPDWTANDFDTLRHETQHFIQDCMNGSNHDNLLESVYVEPTAMARMVLGDKVVDGITRSYRSRTASNHMIRMEHEAFAVARMNVPGEQIEDIKKYCTG